LERATRLLDGPGIDARLDEARTANPDARRCRNRRGGGVRHGEGHSDRMRTGGAVVIGGGEVVNDYGKRWLNVRSGHVASVSNNRRHLNEHIVPVIGLHETSAVTSNEIEGIVAAHDRKVRAGEIGATTARNIWGTCSKMFDDAAHSKPSQWLQGIATDAADGVRVRDCGKDSPRP
jgi:hypothetical protein